MTAAASGFETATAALRAGRVVAYPTESFWALGADATNPAAVRRLFELKRRERKPIALIAGNWQQVEKFFAMTKHERSIARRYWRGALTLVLRPRRGLAADALLGTTPTRSFDRATPPHERRGGKGIGVRVPAHGQARKLALGVGAPITATSANISGTAPTKSSAKVKRDFPGILMVSGRCGRQRLPSTVIEVRENRVRTIRRGAVNLKDYV